MIFFQFYFVDSLETYNKVEFLSRLIFQFYFVDSIQITSDEDIQKIRAFNSIL